MCCSHYFPKFWEFVETEFVNTSNQKSSNIQRCTEQNSAYTYAFFFCFYFFFYFWSILFTIVPHTTHTHTVSYNDAMCHTATMVTIKTCESCTTLVFIILNKWDENKLSYESCVTVGRATILENRFQSNEM